MTKPPSERIVPALTQATPVPPPGDVQPSKPPGPSPHERISPQPASQISTAPVAVPLDPTRGVPIRRKLVPVLCKRCGANTQRTPSSTPFIEGPYKGGFLCQDCRVLDWADHPEIAGDAGTRQWIEEEARRIHLKRAGEGSQLLYDDGANRAYLTRRGTITVDLTRTPFGAPDEYDPDRFRSLMRLFEGVKDAEIAGYEWPPLPE